MRLQVAPRLRAVTPTWPDGTRGFTARGGGARAEWADPLLRWVSGVGERRRLSSEGGIVAGRLEHIWIKRAHRGEMDGRQRGTMRAGRGLEGNANQGGRRQVTVLALEAWNDATAEIGERIDPARRRANLLVS